MALFLHCSVLFELRGLPFKEKKKIKFAVTDNGGSIAFVANKQCSLVVTTAVSSLSPNRLRSIVKHQIPVVGVDYVHRCVEANQRLPVEDFELNISSSENSLAVENKDKWSSSADSASQSQAVHVQQVNATHSAESPRGRRTVIKQRHRVDHDTAQDQAKFPENFQVAKYSVFQKPNSQCWTLLELQSAKSEIGRQYRVARYWRENIQSKRAAVRDEMAFVSTSEEAVSVFQDLTDSLNAEGLRLQRNAPPQVTEMGSAPLQQLLLEEKLNMGALSPEVGVFVELLWQEALGCIHLILNTPVHKISLNDVTRAEGLLFQIQRKITESKMDETISLWAEYCGLLPPRSVVSPNKSTVSKQLDLCQLIRDILNVSEMTLGSAVPSSVGKYRALRCSIDVVPQESSEFKAVTSLLQNGEVQVHQILRVNRAPELQNFRNELGNIKSLLHSSSPHNFVGILSRGLLMPHVAVDQHGVQRTDAGNLGSGIYFTDDIKTTLKYSQCSSTDGSRLMLICDVALGQCKDVFKKDLTLTQAPEGYHSVHGAQGKPGLLSEFMDDEYVVYSTDQVKLKYVVRLSMEGDELKNFTPEIVEAQEPTLPSLDQREGAVEDGIGDIKNPLENVTAGLLNSSGQQIPLKSVHVKCKLMDLLAQVIIFQNYTNESPVPIEAKYVFPLDDAAAVCGFEAFINGKHVVGQVKEKETARREYKQAIEKGHGAYLMDQDAPDVFTISVGNLPPGATVLIKVTFVSELVVKDGSIVFSLPSSVAPWQESAALNQTTQVTVEKICVTDEGASTRQFNLDMSVEMPYEITEVKCSTHKVKMKKTDCKAVVSVLPGEIMGAEGFQLLITLTEVHVPRMWVEKHPSKDSQACMLVFYPKFEAPSCVTSDEVVLLLDASQSMKGESLNTARMLALQVLKTLDHNVQLNVVFFATDYTEAFLSARPIGESCQEARNFIKHFSSTGGSTELWRPLRALSLLPPSSGTRNLLLLSDGHIQNPELTLQLIRENGTHTRLFSCGLSPTANRHMLRALAQAGGGAYEFFDSKSKHTWSEKVGSQIKRMLAPGAKSVSVKWQQFNPAAPPPVQAPKALHALFNDCHTLVFGFVPHCTQATLLGNLSGEEIKTMVSTSELQKTKGTFLHKLTARAIIRDFEDGSLDSDAVLHEEKKAELKSFVIELSKEFSILSQFTSFVAIEERDSGEDTGFTDIPKIIAAEDVDFLPYMSWVEEEEKKEILDCFTEGLPWSDQYEGCYSEQEDEYELASCSYFEGQLSFVEVQKAVDYDTAILEPSDQVMSLCASESVLEESAESIETGMAEDYDRIFLEQTMSRCRESVLEESAESTEAEMAEDYDAIFPEPSSYQVMSRCRESVLEESVDDMPVRSMSKSFDPPVHRALSRSNTISDVAPPPSPPLDKGRCFSRAAPRPCSFDTIARGDRSLALDRQQPPPPPPPLFGAGGFGAAPPPPSIFGATGFGAQPPPPSIFGARGFGAAPPPPPLFGAPGTRHVAPASFAFDANQVCMSSEPPPSVSYSALSSVLLGSAGPMIRAEGSASQYFKSNIAFGQQPPPPPPPVPQSARRHERLNVFKQDGLSTSIFSSSERGSTGFTFGSQLSLPPQDVYHSHPVSISPTPTAPAQELRPISSYIPVSLVTTVEPSVDSVEEMQTTETLTIPHSQNTAILRLRKSRRFKYAAEKREKTCLEELGGFSSDEQDQQVASSPQPNEYLKTHPYASISSPSASKWQIIFSLQHLEGYWEITPQLGQLLNCNISHFANDFLKRKGIASLGLKAQADILKLLATLLVLQLMRLEKLKEGEMLRTLFCLEDSMCRPDHWEAVNRAVKWVVWADRQYPCIYSRLEFGLSWDLSTKQLLGAESIHHCSPLKGLNLNPTPYPGPLMQC